MAIPPLPRPLRKLLTADLVAASTSPQPARWGGRKLSCCRRMPDSVGNADRRVKQLCTMAGQRMLKVLSRESRQQNAHVSCQAGPYRAAPLLESLNAWASSLVLDTLPSGKRRDSLVYVCNKWPTLIRYVEGGPDAIERRSP